MSVYYKLVNKDLKEYIDAGDLGFGIKSYNYDTSISPLLGYLMMDEYNFGSQHLRYTGKEEKFYFKGHWSACPNIQLVSEYKEEYEEISEQEYQHIDHGWMNITIPLARQWNADLTEWFSDSPDMTEWLKCHLYKIP
jgi:hypothetical protein